MISLRGDGSINVPLSFKNRLRLLVILLFYRRIRLRMDDAEIILNFGVKK